MAIKLSEQEDKTLPSTVRAVVANRSSMLAHKVVSEQSNSEKVKQAGQLLNRMQRGEV